MGAPGDESRAFVGLGGNIGDRLQMLRAAARSLAQDVPRTRVIAASSVYETRPVGPSTEPFLNAAIELRTELSPALLLERMLEIEARHGRERRRKWDARTLDLDLLVVQRWGPSGWEAWVVDEGGDGLVLPHPRVTERDFVLVPLGELVGDEALVGGRAPGEWLAAVEAEERTVLRRLEEGLIEGSGG